MRITIDECKERTARMRASKDAFIKACSSNSYENQDEDLKVIDVSPIKSLFCNMNLDNYGTGDESTLVKRRPNDSEFLDLDAKFGKSGIGEVKTLNSIEPTILDFKEFNYDNCSLVDCIFLLQSVLNSPHAYSQSKAFTKHIVDALMQSFDVDFVGRNNFGNNAYRGNFNPRPYPSNSSNNYGNSYNNSYGNIIRCPLILRIVLKNL